MNIRNRMLANAIIVCLGTGMLTLARGAEMPAHDPAVMHEGHEPASSGSSMSHGMQDHASHGGAVPSDAHGDHAKHMAAMQQPQVKVSSHDYVTPDVTLVDVHGNDVSLRQLLAADRPVALNFIFTTCTTICPVMTATFAKMQRELGEKSSRLNVVSISIDPEFDRPPVLQAYAERFRAGDDWTFLTGRSNDVDNVLRAFDVYAGSKMNHQPITLLRPAHGSTWIRVDGLASGRDLALMVDAQLLASPGPDVVTTASNDEPAHEGHTGHHSTHAAHD